MYSELDIHASFIAPELFVFLLVLFRFLVVEENEAEEEKADHHGESR